MSESGLLEFFLQKLKLQHTKKDRFLGTILTFLFPLGFGVLYPRGFVMAFGVAAAALSIIAVIMPVLMVFVIRKRQKSSEKQPYRVTGGKICLVISLALGLVVVGVQLAIVMGL